MEYIVIVIVLAVIIILLRLNFQSAEKDSKQKNSKKDTKKSSKFCPLCNSSLSKGENVKSKTYPASPGSTDTLMDVFGCPNCIPPIGTKTRICPVCKKKIKADGFVIGRYFIKPDKNHLHVLGCTQCRKAK